MNVTKEVTIHRPNVSTFLSSAFKMACLVLKMVLVFLLETWSTTPALVPTSSAPRMRLELEDIFIQTYPGSLSIL